MRVHRPENITVEFSTIKIGDTFSHSRYIYIKTFPGLKDRINCVVLNSDPPGQEGKFDYFDDENQVHYIDYILTQVK